MKHLLEPSPGRYFTDPMNVLDFVVVIFSFSDFLGIEGGSSLVVLRLLQLLRVLKVITVVPELRVILRGVGAGCRSIFWILLLLSGVVYVYSVLGVLMFRENDPRNFRDLGAGVGTVLNIATGECVDYFFINYYGCDHYGYEEDAERCVAPSAQKALAAIDNFVSLILVVGQIMVDAGVITQQDGAGGRDPARHQGGRARGEGGEGQGGRLRQPRGRGRGARRRGLRQGGRNAPRGFREGHSGDGRARSGRGRGGRRRSRSARRSSRVW